MPVTLDTSIPDIIRNEDVWNGIRLASLAWPPDDALDFGSVEVEPTDIEKKKDEKGSSGAAKPRVTTLGRKLIKARIRLECYTGGNNVTAFAAFLPFYRTFQPSSAIIPVEYPWFEIYGVKAISIDKAKPGLDKDTGTYSLELDVSEIDLTAQTAKGGGKPVTKTSDFETKVAQLGESIIETALDTLESATAALGDLAKALPGFDEEEARDERLTICRDEAAKP